MSVGDDIKIDQQRIDELIAHPSESLNVEIKGWIDPDTPEATAKIIKASLALRNRDGGFLVIGFHNDALSPDTERRSFQDLRQLFHIDKVQGLISKFASERFEVGVGYGLRDGLEYPVIVVPEGVTVPVSVNRDLKGQDTYLLREGEIYFRTLGANGIPSTAKVRPSDWRAIMDICFENREANIGRFLRRHIAGPNLEAFFDAIAGMRLPEVTTPTLHAQALEVLHKGEKRKDEALSDRNLKGDAADFIKRGSWSVGLVIDPPKLDLRADQDLLNVLAGANPQYTGWPIWLDCRYFDDRQSRPIVTDKAWQALIISIQAWSPHIDFMRLDPRGEFYLWRVLQDDLLPERVEPKIALDPILVLIRVAEVIAVGISEARALGGDDATLGFAFRWTGLKMRELISWANPLASGYPGDMAHQDVVETFIEVPGRTPLSAIAPYVDQATRDLFLAFRGRNIPQAAIEEWTRRLIERRLNI